MLCMTVKNASAVNQVVTRTKYVDLVDAKTVIGVTRANTSAAASALYVTSKPEINAWHVSRDFTTTGEIKHVQEYVVNLVKPVIGTLAPGLKYGVHLVMMDITTQICQRVAYLLVDPLAKHAHRTMVV